tara:strand:+ start:2628 stop:4070 length:1443 start_codon:yes stop_codon:yes gene_type:complete
MQIIPNTLNLLLTEFVSILILCSNITSLAEDNSIPIERETKTVQIIKSSLPSVAAIQTFKESGTKGIYNIQAGSASVIHEDGYLLTNEHVVSEIIQGNATLYGDSPKSFEVIATMASEDLAIIKINSEKKLPKIPIGRSNDLLLGEPVITIGNPGGLNHSVSKGIISGLNRSTSTGAAFLPWMIQTSAAVSGGNSGGPLINALGHQIGTITSKQMGSENINFAIAMDRVREVLPTLLSQELRYGYWLGIKIDMYAENAKVQSVDERSPAQISGIIPGDVIKSINDQQISNAFDFQFEIIGLSPMQKIALKISRGNKILDIDITVGELELLKPSPEQNLKKGLTYKLFKGEWSKLPEFSSLNPIKSGSVKTPSAEMAEGEIADQYALSFDGYLEIKEEGFYTFSLSSDDGSQFIIGEKLLINNDGLHSFMAIEGRIRLPKGTFPIRVTFFENSGDQKLELRYQGPGIKMQPIPEDVFFQKN